MQLTHKEYCYYLLMFLRESTQGGLYTYVSISTPYPILNLLPPSYSLSLCFSVGYNHRYWIPTTSSE